MTTLLTSPTAVDVTGLDDASQLAAGALHMCALRESGLVACWGRNEESQLGLSTVTTAYAPMEVPGIAGATAIGAGYSHTCAVVAAGAVVASGGTLAAAIAAAAVTGGAGGTIGAVLARWVGVHHALYLQQQLQQGGMLLWVRSWDVADEARAVAILREHAGHNVHVHRVPLAA